MTPNEIDAMEAGHKMDRLVAESILGWRPGFVAPERLMHNDLSGEVADYWLLPGGGQVACVDFRPSLDIAAAWKVIEALRQKKSYRGCELTNYSLNFLEYHWHMEFSYLVTIEDDPDDDPEIGYESADADTAPLAICRAALKAVLAIPA